jgi:cytochrome d ubiquinol oxidase subunit II
MIEWLPTIWFLLLGVLLIGYAILDGFDLGVGIMHLTAKGDRDRRIYMNSIGPLWDGNEVWLVTFGGALFAAFPHAYATVFSGFYLALMLVLLCLIFRAVSLEFRSKTKSALWRRVWDWGFFASSFGAALLFGVAVGNSLVGMPIQADMGFGDLGAFELLLYQLSQPFGYLVGLMTVVMFAMHGTIYLYLKTEGETRDRLVPWMWRTYFAFIAMFVVTNVWTFAFVDQAFNNFRDHWWLAVVPILAFLAILNISRAIRKRQAAVAFLSSSCTIAAFCFMYFAALFPNLVVSTIDVAAVDPETYALGNTSFNLTIENAASSPETLRNMFIIACMGLPFVFAYSAVIYWTFWGKVKLGEHSY